MFYYFDSSAAVKRYAREQGSDWIKSLTVGNQHNIYLSDIRVVEIAAALSKKVRTGELEKEDYDAALLLILNDLAQEDYILAPFNSQLVVAAVQLTTRYPLRGYDAVHLATALRIVAAGPDDGLTFVSADIVLCDAAHAEKLPVENPDKQV